MNKNRRKNIENIQNKILSLGGYLDEIKSDIELIMDEEQEAFDNLPEAIQNSEKGETMQEAIDNLYNALEVDIQSYIDEMDSYLEDAKGV